MGTEKQNSMKEEKISLDDLDTSQYKAMIIQELRDKKSVTDFIYIYIATLWNSQLEPANKRAVINLSDAVNRYTTNELPRRKSRGIKVKSYRQTAIVVD